MARYAIIDQSNKIVNVCEWDGVTQWEPPEDTRAVLDTLGVDQTWTFDGETFTPPPMPPAPPPEPPALTIDQLASVLIAKGHLTQADLSPAAVAADVVAQPFNAQ